MNNAILSCPECGNEIVDTREIVQPYNDFDDYCGFRCCNCKRTFTDDEANVISSIQNGSNS